MTKSQSHIETQRRIGVIKQIDNYVKISSLSGLLVTGSLAWGKNSAITETSDIDFYLLAPSLNSFLSSLGNIPVIPSQTKNTLEKMLNYKSGSVDTRSIKTNIGPYYGAIYLFVEKDFVGLIEHLDDSRSKFFKNLRPNDKPQTKEYKSMEGNKLTFTTPISKAVDYTNNSLWIRTDPLFLTESSEFYGSIFLSHLLFGEIYTDKHKLIHLAQIKVRQFLKSILPSNKDVALVAFQNYLSRIERMNLKTVNNLFNSVWLS